MMCIILIALNSQWEEFYLLQSPLPLKGDKPSVEDATTVVGETMADGQKARDQSLVLPKGQVSFNLQILILPEDLQGNLRRRHCPLC